jgi:glutamate synthase (NADPH/NADH) large chain
MNELERLLAVGGGDDVVSFEPKVHLDELDAEGQLDIEDLLGHYADELRATDQAEEADRVMTLAADAKRSFLMIIPEKVQADPSISTE